MSQNSKVKCAVLNFVPTNKIIKLFSWFRKGNRTSTKFGGQPDWLQAPQWPLSKTTGNPMQFICQIVLETDIFPNAKGKMAYIFMSYEEEATDGTWEPDSGENAVIIQPTSLPLPLSIQTKSIKRGPTLEKEFSVTIQTTEEPAYVPEIEIYKWPKEQQENYYYSLHNNKIGGTPQFIQGDEFPEGDNWKLLLQLDSTQVPFYINFGDAGTGYAFINEEGAQGKFLWQCF